MEWHSGFKYNEYRLYLDWIVVKIIFDTVIQLKKGNRESEYKNKIIFNFIIRHAFFKETVWARVFVL
jgi:hypothetical protein